MKTYREIPVSERLPEFEGIHTVVDADLNMFQATYDKEFSFHDEFNHCDGITHWLEPVDVPTDLYQKVIDTWGRKSQMEMLQEEATELALATRKLIRNAGPETSKNFASEIADVEIMIEQMKFMYPSLENNVLSEKEFKLNRLKNRVENKIFTE